VAPRPNGSRGIKRQAAGGLRLDADRVTRQVGQRNFLRLDQVNGRSLAPACFVLSKTSSCACRRLFTRDFLVRVDAIKLCADGRDGHTDGVGHVVMIGPEDFRRPGDPVRQQDAPAPTSTTGAGAGLSFTASMHRSTVWRMIPSACFNALRFRPDIFLVAQVGASDAPPRPWPSVCARQTPTILLPDDSRRCRDRP